MATDTVNYLLKTMTGDPREISTENADVNLVNEVNGISVQRGKTKLNDLFKIKPQGFIDRDLKLPESDEELIQQIHTQDDHS